MYLQQVGRLSRPSAEGLPTVLLEFAGNCQLHGLPDDERIWSLEGRKKAKADGDVTVPPPPRTCSNCFGQVRIGLSHCPYCGEQLAAPMELPKMLTKAELRLIERAGIEARKAQHKEDAIARGAVALAIKVRNAKPKTEDRACATLDDQVKLAATWEDYKYPRA